MRLIRAKLLEKQQSLLAVRKRSRFRPVVQFRLLPLPLVAGHSLCNDIGHCAEDGGFEEAGQGDLYSERVPDAQSKSK